MAPRDRLFRPLCSGDDGAAGAGDRVSRGGSAACPGRLCLLVLAGLLLSFLFPTAAYAVGVDASSSGKTAGDPGSVNITFNHTAGTLVNGFLVVGVSIDRNQDNNEDVSSVTYQGVPLTKIGEILQSARAKVEMWGLTQTAAQAAGITFAGTHPIVVSFDVAPATTTAVAGAVTFFGVDQAAPTHDFTGVGYDGTQGTHVTVTVPTVHQNDLVLDTIAYDNVELPLPAPDAGQTQRWNDNTGVGSQETPGAGSTKGRAAGSGTGPVTMGWTQNPGFPTDRPGVLAAVAIHAAAPTAVRLISFTTSPMEGGTLLQWRTGWEADNLGFHVYRDEGSGRRRLTREPVAGGALLSGRSALSAGAAYRWWDAGPPGGSYWLEAIDLNGKREWFGPALDSPLSPARAARERKQARAALLSELGAGAAQPVAWERRAAPAASGRAVAGSRGGLRRPAPTGSLQIAPADLAASGAIKVLVRSEGWYRLTQPALRAAGLKAGIDPRNLQLFVEGQQVPIRVFGEADRRFDAGDTVEFYGVGADTPDTGTRVYWLVAGAKRGLRLPVVSTAAGQPGPSSFPFTLELKERTIYFPALQNGPAENWFGRVLVDSSTPEEFSFSLDALQPGEAGALAVAVQGVSAGDHRISVRFNGASLGELMFRSQERGTATLPLDAALLHAGANQVVLASEGGEGDFSLVDVIRLTYPRAYTAAGNSLRFLAPGGTRVTLAGFTAADLLALDVTDPDAPAAVPATAIPAGAGGYALRVDVPGLPGQARTLVALAAGGAASAAVVGDTPSSWRTARGADLVIITPGALAASLAPLRDLRQAQGLRVAVVDIADVYDEFSWGEKDPAAIRAFMAWAKRNWRVRPRALLLAGEASADRRDYLGLGPNDQVPTALIATRLLDETASDDWFVDFNEDAIPDLAVGRLPAGTPEDAARLVARIVGYEARGNPGGGALLVSDVNDIWDFEGSTHALRELLPAGMAVEELRRSGYADPAAALRAALSAGPALVNYMGHGSLDVWRGLLTGADAGMLTNGERLSVVVIMDCLNGQFQNPWLDSMAEALLRAENGGAVGVWASSGLCEPDGQAELNRAFYRELFQGGGVTLGEAAARAKAGTSDPAVRRTWIFFGDPTARLRP